MGKAGDPDAVVDSRGKVFGVHGLRVVDVSAFPLLPPGHTQSTVCKRDIFLHQCLPWNFSKRVKTDASTRFLTI